jgi:hypothetical protein
MGNVSKTFIGAAQLSELQTALRDVGDDIGDLVLSVLDEIAGEALADVRGRVPHRTGKARGAYQLRGHAITVAADDAPYVPWLEFGGRVGRKKSNLRAYVPAGRYLYPALGVHEKDIEKKIDDLIEQATHGYLTIDGG